METKTFKTYLQDTLSHLRDEIDLTLNPLSPKTQEMESLADVLSDPESFDFKVEEMGTSPRIARWNLLNAQSTYHSLVVRSNSAQGAIQTFAKQIYGGSLDRSKSSFDMYARIETCLLQIWCHIFDHWLGVKIVDPLYSPDMTNLEGSSTKTESKENVKMPNEENIKTKFPDIMIRSGPKRQFTGVNIARPKRKRGPSNDSEDSKANLPKKIKQEIKKEEDTDMVIGEVKPVITNLFQIPPYPSSWPDSIIRRLKTIPPFDPLPALSEDFMSRTFSRQECSMKFGGSWVQYDSRWKRKRAALQQMPGLGHTFVIGALLKYNFPPHGPCAPGILLNSPGEMMPHSVTEPRTVFVCVRPGAWLYMGEYRLRLAKPLAEWGELPSKMKQAHSTAPTRRALDRGGKKLWVYTMQCIGYHEGIQRAICTLDSCSS